MPGQYTSPPEKPRHGKGYGSAPVAPCDAMSATSFGPPSGTPVTACWTLSDMSALKPRQIGSYAFPLAIPEPTHTVMPLERT